MISVFGRPGSDLLFQVLRLSTIGAGEFNGRVRDGIGFRLPAITTRPAKDSPQPHVAHGQDILRGRRKAFKQAGSHRVFHSRRRRAGPEWALINESDQADRAISTGKLNASWSFALTHPAYQRDGLSRLSRETSFRGGFPA